MDDSRREWADDHHRLVEDEDPGGNGADPEREQPARSPLMPMFPPMPPDRSDLEQDGR